jgi:G3E family GTPase
MNNGCICCTVRGDLIRIIEGLMKRKDKFDGILVETTGLADPGPVAQTFFTDDEVKARTRLDAIVTVVDAKHFLGQLEQGDEAQEQVAFADVILLNKTDLVSEDDLKKVESKIKSINRYARIFRTQKSQIELAAILDKGAFDLQRILEFEPDFLHHGHDHDHEEEVKSLSLSADRPVDPDKFQKWMGALLQLRGPDIFRSKGILAIDGAPRRYVYQGVHMMMDSDWGTPWKEGEKRSSKLVFIGRNLDGENLQRGFNDCLK